MSIKTDLLIVGGVALAVFLMRDRIGAALSAVNPLDSDNVINRTFTNGYQALTGSTGTLGTDIYDATHGGALDVTSDQNMIYRGVNKIGEALTGSQDWTLGTAIYNATHWWE